MANLTNIEKSKLEKLFEMESGYVLDFTNASFRQFVRDSIGVDIQAARFGGEKQSKAKRLRLLWESGSDSQVGKLSEDMISVLSDEDTNINWTTKPTETLITSCLTASYRLQGKIPPATQNPRDVNDFLRDDVDEIPIAKLKLDGQVSAIIDARIIEVKKCLKSDAPLSVIFLCGSILEGLLLGIATSNSKQFNQCPVSPRDAVSGKTRQFHDWKLSEFIDVAHNLGILGLDVKKYGHNLRDFRNYIHPYQQMASGFCPDSHTAKICWQVLKAALHDVHQKVK